MYVAVFRFIKLLYWHCSIGIQLASPGMAVLSNAG
jgi:hypothetical protein